MLDSVVCVLEEREREGGRGKRGREVWCVRRIEEGLGERKWEGDEGREDVHTRKELKL